MATVRIDQVLHGYQDGHRQLAASTEISRDARHVMLSMSDLSGRSMVEGFERYLSGYALPGSDLFAFAATWYAPEMDRPGCVWTHTLLMQHEALSELDHIADLRLLFRRPVAKQRWDDFQTTLTIEIGKGGERRLELPGLTPISLLIDALYRHAESVVVLPAENSLRYEDLALEAWSQQWPQLRRSFYFCTGAIAARSLAGRPFDLQVVPKSSVRELRRDLKSLLIVNLDAAQDAKSRPGWVRAAVADIVASGVGSFRTFLRKVAGDTENGRHWFAPLAELYATAPELASGEYSIREMVDYVGGRFPNGKQPTLKELLFGQDAVLGRRLCPDADETQTLIALATTPFVDAFDSDALGVEERFASLSASRPRAAEELVEYLVRNDHNAIGERLLLAHFGGVDPDTAVQFIEQKPALAALIVRLNPVVAASPRLWNGSYYGQWALFDALADEQLSSDRQELIVNAMLVAGSDAVAEGVARRWGSTAISAILSWFDGSRLVSPEQLPHRWRMVLRSTPRCTLSWLSAENSTREATAALIADVSDPHSKDAHFFGVDP